MRTELFDYPLPEDRIAQHPTEERGGARMLEVGRGGLIHRHIRDFPMLVPAGALVVLNDTRVRKARLLGRKAGTGGRCEIFLLGRVRDEPSAGGRHRSVWTALGRSNKALQTGVCVDIAGGVRAHVIERGDHGELTVVLETDEPAEAAIERHGHVPLPPYVRRDDEPEDAERYQTVFADALGSVAAPTAGLHLTAPMLLKFRERGIRVGRVTLHVGVGTFRPVSSFDLNDHAMHSEQMSVGADLVSQVADARQRGAPVVAVGTTVVRALESAAAEAETGHVREFHGPTSLLIQPGYAFRVVDAMLTNFHMPRSTLLALVSAFAGYERTRAAYEFALQDSYRFLSYGDAMWIPERS